MKRIILVPLIFLTSCSTLPQLYTAVEDVETDKAIELSVSKEALQKNAILEISILKF